MGRSPQYTQGRREGVKWAITWLYERAAEMNDPHAKAILNVAGFHMSTDAKRNPNLKVGKTKRQPRFGDIEHGILA